MELQEALQTKQELANLSPADALAVLISVVEGAPDDSLWHWNGVIARLTDDAMYDAQGNVVEYNVIGSNGLTAIQAATCRDTLALMPTGYLSLDALLTAGCDLSSPQLYALVQFMEVQEPPLAVTILNAILAIGATPQLYYWDKIGLSAAPTLTDVINAQAALQLQSWKSHIINEIINPARSISEIKSGIAGA